MSNEELLRQEAVLRGKFDSDYYLGQYPDVKRSGRDPLRHYMLHGWREGRNPTREFSTTMYLMLNEDVLRSGINPFYHYILHGVNEGRLGGNVSNLRNDHLLSRVPHRMQRHHVSTGYREGGGAICHGCSRTQ